MWHSQKEKNETSSNSSSIMDDGSWQCVKAAAIEVIRLIWIPATAWAEEVGGVSLLSTRSTWIATPLGMTCYKYVVTAQKPTATHFTVKGPFTASTDVNLILG